MKLFLGLVVSFFMSTSFGNVLTFKFKGLKELKGSVRLAIYNSKETFLDEKQFFRSALSPATSEVVMILVADIPYGIYAVAAFHDSDDNNKMTKNFLGIPKELFGFSNGAQPSILGAPSFDESKIDFNASAKVFEINLREAF
ncbi:MAG: DUF2141 domain-containing protein [Pseudomonadota bacterium]|nr:DUF2141 domain-containing protein [Pseudomonadota bacterium]